MLEQKNPTTTIHQEHIPKKTSWPEVVGLSGVEAEKKIKEDMPTAETDVVHELSPLTKDYVFERVRIIVDSTGKVVRIPSIG